MGLSIRWSPLSLSHSTDQSDPIQANNDTTWCWPSSSPDLTGVLVPRGDIGGLHPEMVHSDRDNANTLEKAKNVACPPRPLDRLNKKIPI